MKLGKLAVTTVLTTAAVALAGGTATAAPASPVDHGVTYHTVTDAAHHTVTAVVDNGTVAASADGKVATIRDAAGNTIGSIPTSGFLTYQDLVVPVSATVGANGHSLTVSGVPGLHRVNSQQWFMDSLTNSVPGIIIGALAGGLIGLPLAVVGAIPGALIGGLIGMFAAGGQPLIDSGIAFFSGN